MSHRDHHSSRSRWDKERAPSDRSTQSHPHKRRRDDGHGGRTSSTSTSTSTASKRQRNAAPRWGKPEDEEDASKSKLPEEKEKANFGLSGALNEDENTGKLYKGILLKWSEPADAHLPKTKWRLYVFKNDTCLATLHLHRQSAFLVGREKSIADIYVEHPSCSKQHAVLQFKIKVVPREPGSVKKPKRKVRPYILDLESTNGTFLNGEKVPPSRYVELMEKDVIKFGESSREYVLLSEKASSSK